MTAAAVEHLRNSDPIMAGIIARVGACTFAPDRTGTHFGAVTRAIVFQQLSGKAAATIHGRFKALFPDTVPEPAALIAMPEETLRSAGLSRQKIGYLRDLSTRVRDGEVPFHSIESLDDAQVVKALTSVKGVGRWTAEMFLMFRLGRPDVLPVGDLGIQKAVKIEYRMRALPPPARLEKVAAKWAPYRTVASWYLWRSLDGEGGQL